MRLLVVIFLCSSGWNHAFAQAPQRPALHWSRDATAGDCIDPRALALQVTALTGTVLVEPSSADLSIEGHVRKSERGEFEVRIAAVRHDGVQRGARTLRQRGGACRALDASIAFVMAVMIDPDLALEKLPASLVALGAEGPAPEKVLLAELQEQPPRPVILESKGFARETVNKVAAPQGPTKVRPTLELQAGATLGIRELARTTLGVFASGDVLLQPWLAMEVLLRAAFMASKLRVDSTHSVSALALGGVLLVCPRYLMTRAVFAEGCVGAEVSVTRAEGKGFAPNQAASLLSYGAHLGLGAGVKTSQHVSLHMRGFARIWIDEGEFTYRGSDGEHLAFDLGRVSGGMNLGVRYAF